MHVVKGKPKVKTISEKSEITAKDILELKFFLNGILIANKTLSETLSWWMTKNEKKLNAELAKVQFSDKAIDDKYVSKDEKGRFKLWDKVEGGFTCLLKERADGSVAYVDVDGNEMPDLDKPMWFLVEGKEKEEQYLKEKEENSEAKRTVQLVKVARNLLENINFPTMGSSSQSEAPRKLNRELFYDALVIDEDTIAEEEDGQEESND